MTRANPPPRGCVILALIAVDGDNWARHALVTHPGLLWHVKRQAEGCERCTIVLNRLFPEGIPETEDPRIHKPEKLKALLGQLREETGKELFGDDPAA